ncbi:MAG: LamG domain-containing protein [Ignavibacteria bacterium]|nr:LamG domain-containing protein [Ignavibacteria bacterium]
MADIGGNDDGLALLLNSSTLIAAVASNNVRQNISTGYSSTGWNHIVLVYNKNSLKLYVNGNQVAANNSLSFNSIGTTTNGSRIGRVNGTNAYNSGTGYFSGWIDNFSIFSKALSLSDIDSLMTNQNPGQSFASTLALPGVPQNPTNLLASSKNANSIQITWADNSSNETNFELYRSNNNNTNYQLLTTLC